MIGVLALQGGFAAHCRALTALNIPHREVRLPRELENLDGLILPGGESTTMLKLLKSFDMLVSLAKFGDSGKPVLGTCAGAILMCERVNFRNQQCLGWIPAAIDRNAYGSQRESFQTEQDIPEWNLKGIPALFIRAPRFTELAPGVSVLSRFGEDITGISYLNFTAVTFHPELGGDTRFHQAWYQNCARHQEMPA